MNFTRRAYARCPWAIRIASLLIVGSAFFHGSARAESGLVTIDAFTPGGRSISSAVSSDGSVVVGNAVAGPLGETAAFRWTQAGGLMRLDGLAGGGGKTFSAATAVSADGSVIAGNISMPISYIYGAFVWSAATGPVSLGFLNGGTTAYANGISGDGSVVVGGAADGASGHVQRAFRWTSTGGMISLGTLSGSGQSVAYGANSDGSVIVGTSDIDPTHHTRAFRWTSGGGMVNLGVLPGLDSSSARAVASSGNVVVGASYPNGVGGPAPDAAGTRAFRWTPAVGMTSLGTLNGGSLSFATGVSGDGTTVVGYAVDGAAGNAQRAFRWSEARGIETVENWLRANAVAVAGDVTTSAQGVNSDGSVVVGTLAGERAFVARVASTGSGMITLAELSTSLAGAAAALDQGVQSSQLALHGLHGDPLERRSAVGRTCIHATADAGRDDHGSRDGWINVLEVGICRRMSAQLQLGLDLGRVNSRQALSQSGTSRFESTFAVVEGLYNWDGTSLWTTLSAAYLDGDSDVRRGYLNAGLPDVSSGRPGMKGHAARLRVDWEDAFEFAQIAVTPYADISRAYARRDPYVETGGGFPARYDGQRIRSTEIRAGAVLKRSIAARTDLRLTLEAVHRLEADTTPTTGEAIGLFAFSIPGAQVQRSWLRMGIAASQRAGPGALTIAFNTTTSGQAPNYWVKLGYRAEF